MKTELKEPCRKCLLAQTDEKEVLAEVKRAIDRLKPDEKVSESEYGRRLEICLSCGELNAGCCVKCGCYVELRAALKNGRCPLAGKNRKW